MNYNIYTPIIYIPMPAFTEVNDPSYIKTGTSCGYAITYTTKWKDYWGTVINLPSFIQWNAANFRYEVQSNDPADLTHSRQTYELELTASTSVADMNPIYQKTHKITLIVNNGCLND